jgi:hypothetical protein
MMMLMGLGGWAYHLLAYFHTIVMEGVRLLN